MINFSWSPLQTTNVTIRIIYFSFFLFLLLLFLMAFGHVCRMAKNVYFSVITVNEVKWFYLHLLLQYVSGETRFHILIQIPKVKDHDLVNIPLKISCIQVIGWTQLSHVRMKVISHSTCNSFWYRKQRLSRGNLLFSYLRLSPFSSWGSHKNKTITFWQQGIRYGW